MQEIKHRLSLQDFQNQTLCDRRFIWQLSSVPNLRGFLDAVKDEGNRQMCTEVIDAFEIEVVSIATELEKVVLIILNLSISKKQ